MSRHQSFPAGPLPGFRQRPRGLFVDRWGTLLELPERGYCARFEDVQFLAGATDALFRAHRAGWYVYLIGNEDAVARGRITLGTWERVRDGVDGHLRGQGVPPRRFYACVDHPEGVEGRRADSVFMLPNTGIFYQAAHLDGIELGKSWVIGDSSLELVAGWRAGLRLAAVRTGLGLGDGTYDVDPDLVAPDLASAIGHVLDAEGALAL